MRWLTDRLARLRWMAVPVAAYLVITLALPVTNGALGREGFAVHAGWVLAGCAVVLALALIVGVVLDVVSGRARAARRRAAGAGAGAAPESTHTGGRA
jgi:hypothetical protein